MAEVLRRKDRWVAVGHLAAIVSVAETTMRNAIREVVKLGLVTVEERLPRGSGRPRPISSFSNQCGNSYAVGVRGRTI